MLDSVSTVWGNVEVHPGPRAPGHTRRDPGPPAGIYWESQERSYCYMHSSHMLIGRRLLTSPEVVTRLNV